MNVNFECFGVEYYFGSYFMLFMHFLQFGCKNKLNTNKMNNINKQLMRFNTKKSGLRQSGLYFLKRFFFVFYLLSIFGVRASTPLTTVEVKIKSLF